MTSKNFPRPLLVTGGLVLCSFAWSDTRSAMRPMTQGTLPTAGAIAPAAVKPATHAAVAIVRQIDRTHGQVTLAHEPIVSLHWPAMTMAFAVKDKRLFDKLVVGQRVNVELAQQGSEYVVVAVKSVAASGR